MKEIHMTAEEFRNCQRYLDLNIDDMAKELRRSRRAVANYRKDGITDELVAMRVEFLVSEKVARESGVLCIVKGCDTVAEPDSPYCQACALERMEVNK